MTKRKEGSRARQQPEIENHGLALRHVFSLASFRQQRIEDFENMNCSRFI